MAKTITLSKISIAILVGGLVLVSHTQPANAGLFRQNTPLGRLTLSDNVAYWRAQGRIAVSTPPWDRNQLCQWKYGRNNVWGEPVSWWGSASWDTNCYRWRWFWQ